MSDPHAPIDWERAARARSADGSPLFNISKDPEPEPRRTPALQNLLDGLMDIADAIAEQHPVEVTSPGTVLGWLQRYAAQNPRYYAIAADHTFDCRCPNCIVFLTLTGLDDGDENGIIDPRWIALRGEPVGPEGMRADQVARIHKLAGALL